MAPARMGLGRVGQGEAIPDPTLFKSRFARFESRPNLQPAGNIFRAGCELGKGAAHYPRVLRTNQGNLFSSLWVGFCSQNPTQREENKFPFWVFYE